MIVAVVKCCDVYVWQAFDVFTNLIDGYKKLVSYIFHGVYAVVLQRLGDRESSLRRLSP